MQIDSLTKLGKFSCAEELTCITDMFSVEQSVFISNTLRCTCHEKNVARNFVKIFHINSDISATGSPLYIKYVPKYSMH